MQKYCIQRMKGNPDIVMTNIYDLVPSLALYGYNRFIRPRYRPGLTIAGDNNYCVRSAFQPPDLPVPLLCQVPPASSS